MGQNLKSKQGMHLGLLELANKNIGHAVTVKFQINDKKKFCINCPM